MGLIPCTACQRHHRVHEPACPFCGVRAAVAGVAVAVGLALVGCGPTATQPPKPPENQAAQPAPPAPPDEGAPDGAEPDDDAAPPRDRGREPQPMYGVDFQP